MSKRTVNLGGGNSVVIDTNRPKVVDALAALVTACAIREFPIGMHLMHADDEDDGGGRTQYELVKVHDRAYLVNTKTGLVRNSRKVVYVQGTSPKKSGQDYFVTEIPAEKDRFFDPENPGSFLDC